MQIFSGEPLVLVGPGSEWFWTALSSMLVAISLIAIYFQLRAQRSSKAFDQGLALNAEWESENLWRKRAAVWEAIRDGAALTDLPRDADSSITNYWERVGTLVRKGHVPAEVLAGNDVTLWWFILGPSAMEARVEFALPAIAADFEWLAAHFASDSPPPSDIAFIEERAARGAAVARAFIRDFEAMRTVTIAPAAPAFAGVAAASPADAPLTGEG